MRYDLIARFYKKADDKLAAYSCPLGIYHESLSGDLEKRGFIVNEDTTPGYLDYIKTDASENEVHELVRPGFVTEMMDIIYDGNGPDGYERIEIEANEIDQIDDEGTLPPFGLFIHRTFVEFQYTEPLSPVTFIKGDPYNATGKTPRFIVPLKKLKDYFDVLTMYEVRDCLRDRFAKGEYRSFDELKDFFECGFDDAVDLATRKLFGLRDSGGQSQLYHAIAVGMSGAGKTEQLAGFLYETVRIGLVTLKELRTYGYSDEVVNTLALLPSAEGPEENLRAYARIAASQNLSACFVLRNYYQHHRDYAESIEYWPDVKRYEQELSDLHAVMKDELLRQGSKEGHSKKRS